LWRGSSLNINTKKTEKPKKKKKESFFPGGFGDGVKVFVIFFDTLKKK